MQPEIIQGIAQALANQFLENGQHNGAKIKNGHEMLVLQAEKAWKIWNKVR